MKSLKLALFFFCAALCLAGEAAEKFHLFKNGKPACVIVEHPKLKRWINEFVLFAKSCTGSTISVQKNPHKTLNNITFVLKTEFDKEDSFTIDFPDKRTMRITGSNFSVKNGIAYIFEKYFGVRFLLRYPHWLKRPAGYDKDLETVFPRVRNVSLPLKKDRQSPSVNLQRLFSGNLYYDWKVRQHSFPGGHGMTIFPFPAKKYAPDNSWPEEIIPTIRGKKFVFPKFNPKEEKPYNKYRYFWQPCWSNPNTAKIALENIVELFKKEPVFRGQKRYHVELSVNDNGGCCECAKCLKAVGGKRSSVGGYNYSELYWKWIKDVAMGMEKKLPGVYIVAYAYREVFDPPSFKLPKNVIVQICRELVIGAISKTERKKIENTFREWSKRASLLFIYDYLENSPHPTGGYTYVLPRVHINSYAEMFRMAYKYNVRGVYQEANHNIPLAGPVLYVMSRLYWDVNTDVMAHFKDWCEHAVGKKAAPYLMKYYLNWEKYWLRPEILKTNWGLAIKSIYMPLGEAGTYTYALTEKDMKEFRSLMDQVVKYAGTPLQKKRARFFRRLYLISERSVDCLYSLYTEPNGFVKDAATAVKLIKSIPKAVASMKYLEKETLCPNRLVRIVTNGVSDLKAIVPFKNHPAVRKALKEIAKRKDLPVPLRAQLEILSGSTKYKNLLEHGSFEKGNIRAYKLRSSGSLSKEVASHGKFSYKSVNGCVRFIQRKGVIPLKTYLVMVDVYSKAPSIEGRMTLMTNPRAGNRNSRFNCYRDLRVSKGWQTFTSAFVASNRFSEKCDNIYIQISLDKFERDEPVYFDNVRLYQLD